MKIYCDMDGVLVDLVGGIIKASKSSLNSELITEILSMDWSFRKEHPDPMYNQALNEIKTSISDNVDFWADKLEPMPDALELWDYISQFDVSILSHPWDKCSQEGKEFWVLNNLETRPSNIYLPMNGNKHQYAVNEDNTPNILIDDFKKYITKWTDAGGIAVTHTSTENTISELKKIFNS
tara:strand:- start:2460 stop:2999 length:540 start_codon:yes stop_codon:yes gene_type:complete